jgi:hypothetical protein
MKTFLVLYMAMIADYSDESKNKYLTVYQEMPSMEVCQKHKEELGDVKFYMGNREFSLSLDCVLDT